jgi:putative spermidine/putrescine transport system permease protein
LIQAKPIAARSRPASLSVWWGMVPFFLFALAFEIMPLVTIIKSSLTGENGLTLQYYQEALSSKYMIAIGNSFRLAATTATLGMVFGFLVAYAMITSRNKPFRNSMTALADVTTNFGGAPLAFAFIVILGSTGFITMLLKSVGVNLYPNFRIYSISGLVIAYLYFQIPLMILIIVPSLLGLRQEWREAAVNLGASSFQFWLRIGFPILFPALLSGFLLLFANAFGAYATAWTLTGPDVDLITIRIGSLIRGEVQLEPQLADALAVISLLIMSSCVAGYILLTGRNRRMRA